MQSLLSYGSDDEDEEEEKDQRGTALPPPPPSLQPPPAVKSPAAPVLSTLLAPSTSSFSKASPTSVLSSLAASLSSLTSSSSPFSTSLFDPSLDAAAASSQSAPPSAPPASLLVPPSPAPAVSAPPPPPPSRPKLKLPSAASLLADLPDDADGWRERTAEVADSGSGTAAVDRKQWKAMPMPDSLKVGPSENDRFRLASVPVTHSLSGDARQLPPQVSTTAEGAVEDLAMADSAAAEAAVKSTPAPRSNGQWKRHSSRRSARRTAEEES